MFASSLNYYILETQINFVYVIQELEIRKKCINFFLIVNK